MLAEVQHGAQADALKLVAEHARLGRIALFLVWLLSRSPTLVSGPAALLLVVILLGGPFCGALVATRSDRRRSRTPS
jgi:hypothetical protein